MHVETKRWLLSHQIFLQVCGPVSSSQNHHRPQCWQQHYLETGSKHGFILNVIRPMVWLQTLFKHLKHSLILLSAGFGPCCFLKQHQKKLPWSAWSGDSKVQELGFHLVLREQFCKYSFMGWLLIVVWGFFVPLLLIIDMALIQNTFWALRPFSFLTHCVALGISGIMSLPQASLWFPQVTGASLNT